MKVTSHVRPIGEYPAAEILACSRLMSRLERHITDLTLTKNTLSTRYERLFKKATALDDAAGAAYADEQANPPPALPAKVEPYIPAAAYTNFLLNPGSLNAAATIGDAIARDPSSARLPKPTGPSSQATRASVPVQAPAAPPSSIASELLYARDDLRELMQELEKTLNLTAYTPR